MDCADLKVKSWSRSSKICHSHVSGDPVPTASNREIEQARVDMKLPVSCLRLMLSVFSVKLVIWTEGMSDEIRRGLCTKRGE